MSAEAFATTHWSLVLSARGAESGASEAALEALCRTYWRPLYAWLRRDGHAPADAEDLVQGFFAGFLARDSLRNIGREKGRFRSFLLAALRNHLLTVKRNDGVQKRGAGVARIPLDDPEWLERCEAGLAQTDSAELAFDRAWAETILERSMRQLREEYGTGERRVLFDAMRVWLVREARVGEYAEAAGRLGISEGALAVAVHRMRSRLRQRVRGEVAETLASPADIEEEMRHLFRIVAAG